MAVFSVGRLERALTGKCFYFAFDGLFIVFYSDRVEMGCRLVLSKVAKVGAVKGKMDACGISAQLWVDIRYMYLVPMLDPGCWYT